MTSLSSKPARDSVSITRFLSTANVLRQGAIAAAIGLTWASLSAQEASRPAVPRAAPKSDARRSEAPRLLSWEGAIRPTKLRLLSKLNSEGTELEDKLPPLLASPTQEPVPLSKQSAPLPVNSPWWMARVQQPIRPDLTAVHVTLESLLLSALDHSSQIRVYSELPLIRETAVIEADAAFDPAAFVESRWDDTNDPVGNTLTTGGPNRYKNDNLSNAAGLRSRTRVGGRLEVSERFGWQDTNSTYFSPKPQGTAKLALSYTQPLLRGRGRCYNESLIVLAQLDTDVAEDEFSRQLQAHLLEVARSYWGLYLERANLLQKTRSYVRARAVMKRLAERVEIDAVASQIQRAEAEVATRESEMIRARMAVENAEARIRALVNDPCLGENESLVELIPMDFPTDQRVPFDLQSSLTIALQSRPEVGQAIKQIKAGCVRSEMSKHELLPVLNLVTESYLAGLQNGGSVGDAFTDQFRVGGPSYSVGLQFEVPLGNRAAKTRNERRLLELRQLRNQYETTVRTLSLEVEVAVREMETSYAETLAQARAVKASETQLDYLEKRWELLPGDGGNAALMLDNLLTAQDRLVRSEGAYLQAWITYNLALINHRRATGELLQQHDISWADYMDECEGVKSRLLFKSTVTTAQPDFPQPLVAPLNDPADTAVEFESANASDSRSSIKPASNESNDDDSELDEPAKSKRAPATSPKRFGIGSLFKPKPKK